jgi:hypothetical protein
VLWTAVAALQRDEEDVVSVIYTGDAVSVSKADMIAKVEVCPRLPCARREELMRGGVGEVWDSVG